jgi:biopolymer transport protein TolR
MHSTGHERSGIRSEINVTPLVDVCLVLLIIFMVVTPMLTDQIAIQLPKVSNPDKKPRRPAQVTISIPFKADGLFFLDNQRRALSSLDLRVRLTELRKLSLPPDLVVRADRRVDYGRVRTVLATINAAGFRDAALIAEKGVTDRAQTK